MATAMRSVTVCDFDGQLATTTITFRGPDGGSYQLDVCDGTLREFMRKAHTPRRGRKPGTTNEKTTAKRKTVTRKKTTRKRRTAKK